jgi:hypothetical protein
MARGKTTGPHIPHKSEFLLYGMPDFFSITGLPPRARPFTFTRLHQAPKQVSGRRHQAAATLRLVAGKAAVYIPKIQQPAAGFGYPGGILVRSPDRPLVKR